MSNATKVVHQQEKIFTLLKMHANDKGYVKGLTVDSIARLTGVTGHDVAKTLWGLQKRNLLGFSERKGTGGHSVPYRFRIKKQGLTADQETVRAAEPIDNPNEVEILVDVVDGQVEVRAPAVEGVNEGQPLHLTRRTTPRAKDYIKELVNREVDLRFAATVLGDHGLEELGLQVLEHVVLKDEELQQLRQLLEI